MTRRSEALTVPGGAQAQRIERLLAKALGEYEAGRLREAELLRHLSSRLSAARPSL